MHDKHMKIDFSRERQNIFLQFTYPYFVQPVITKVKMHPIEKFALELNTSSFRNAEMYSY